MTDDTDTRPLFPLAVRRTTTHLTRRRRRLRRWLYAAIITPVLLALSAAIAFGAYWNAEVRQRYSVAVPPPNAAPNDVVAAWVNAINARDTATADALSTPNGRAEISRWSACHAFTFSDTDDYYSQTPDGALYKIDEAQIPKDPTISIVWMDVGYTCIPTSWPFVGDPSHTGSRTAAARSILVHDKTSGRWLVDYFSGPIHFGP